MNSPHIVARKADRKDCRLFGKVLYLNEEVEARILNLSATGVRLEIRAPLHAGIGSRVQVAADDLGTLHGIVRWSYKGRVGIFLDPNSNSRGKVASYFRFFHQEVKPLLSR